MEKAFILAMTVQVFLAMYLYLQLRYMRLRAAQRGEGDINFYRSGIGKEVDDIMPTLRNLTNQFELPVLFYVICLLIIIFDAVDWVFLSLAWIFVLTRLYHFYAQTIRKKLKIRFLSFFVGLATLAFMWLYFVIWLMLFI